MNTGNDSIFENLVDEFSQVEQDENKNIDETLDVSDAAMDKPFVIWFMKGWNALSEEEKEDRMGEDFVSKLTYEAAQNQLRNLFDEDYIRSIYRRFKAGKVFESEEGAVKSVDEQEVIVNKIREAVLNEGQFSWLASDTNQPIYSTDGHKTTIYMLDDKGNQWKETDYDGYGVFGGKDFYELLAEMNGLESDRQLGIKLAFKDNGSGEDAEGVKYPKLVENPELGYNAVPNPKSHENQGWYEEEEDVDDYDPDEEVGDWDEDQWDDTTESCEDKKDSAERNADSAERNAEDIYPPLSPRGKERFVRDVTDESLLDQTIDEFRKVEADPNKNVDEGAKDITPAQSVTPFEKMLESCQQVKESDLADIANTKLGWAVAAQLKSILEDPTSAGIENAELNVNAVRLIYRFVKDRTDEDSKEVASAIEDWVEEDLGDPSVLEALDEQEEVVEKHNWGKEIERLDINVADSDRAEFDKAMNSVLNKLDPGSDLSISDAVNRMSDSAAGSLYRKLADFRMEESKVEEDAFGDLEQAARDRAIANFDDTHKDEAPEKAVEKEVVEEETTDEKCDKKSEVEAETTDEACGKKHEVEEAAVEEGLTSSDKDIFISKASFDGGWDVQRTREGSNMSTVMFTFDTSEEAAAAGEQIAHAIGGNFHGDKDPRGRRQPGTTGG